MKKILCLITCLLLILSISACSSIKEPSTNISNTNVMMIATSSFVGMNSNNQEAAVVNQWTLYYDGLLEYKSEASGGNTIKSTTLSMDELENIETILKNEKDATDDDVIMDGISFHLKYYDSNGKLVSEYDGYLNNGNNYQQLYNILNQQKALQE